MGSKSKKRQQKRAAQQAAEAKPKSASKPAPPPVNAEEVVAAIVESIAPALFDSSATDGTDGAKASRKSAPNGEEHRAHPRVSMQVEIGLGSDTHFFSGLSGDVSEGGVFVQTYQEIPVGSEVEVELALPTGHVTTHGTVRWHRSKSESAPPGVGVAFESLSDQARTMIHAFCEARAPLYYDVEH